MGLDFIWLGLEKSDPPSPGDLEKIYIDEKGMFLLC